MVNTTPRPLYAHERDPVSIAREAEWAPGLVCTSAENLSLSGFVPWTAQPVAMRYTDSANPAQRLYATFNNSRI
jgi:hypothetical protein